MHRKNIWPCTESKMVDGMKREITGGEMCIATKYMEKKVYLHSAQL